MYAQQSKEMSKFLAFILKSSGYSFSKKIYFNDLEDKEKSRRVSFKIILHSSKNEYENLVLPYLALVFCIV